MSDRFNEHPSITAILAPYLRPSRLAEAEKFRVVYEARHGPTDLTNRYTTQLPADEHNWLKAEHLDRYVQGMPPYIAAFYRNIIRESIQRGEGDSLDPKLVELYVSGRFPDERGNGTGPVR